MNDDRWSPAFPTTISTATTATFSSPATAAPPFSPYQKNMNNYETAAATSTISGTASQQYFVSPVPENCAFISPHTQSTTRNNLTPMMTPSVTTMTPNQQNHPYHPYSSTPSSSCAGYYLSPAYSTPRTPINHHQHQQHHFVSPGGHYSNPANDGRRIRTPAPLNLISRFENCPSPLPPQQQKQYLKNHATDSFLLSTPPSSSPSTFHYRYKKTTTKSPLPSVSPSSPLLFAQNLMN
eukprot:CAMPEP_0172508810 /NCGR_PEP_ID=MMETSP1066-20121228/215074_1 /TAXON_ID=671091 /ORGANISM="Coscinodiscus wailesii, Strain CCMP2513" /LENGTH=236 /DNA_ID=CAMNT_0013286983 /DNA_START=267 /DNA_END=974 /DNA_ORIENTATION=+